MKNSRINQLIRQQANKPEFNRGMLRRLRNMKPEEPQQTGDQIVAKRLLERKDLNLDDNDIVYLLKLAGGKNES